MLGRLARHWSLAINVLMAAGLLSVVSLAAASGQTNRGSCPPTPRAVPVKLVVATRSVAAGEPVHFRVDNTAGPTITYGADYSIQECVAGAWTLAPFSPTAATRQRIRQRPSRGRWWHAPIPSTAATGRYRIRKSVEVGRSVRWLYGDFSVVAQSASAAQDRSMATSQKSPSSADRSDASSRIKARLLPDRRSTHPGGIVRVRVVNEGHEDVAYGLPYRLFYFKKGIWVALPAPPQFGPRFVLRGGELGSWQIIRLSKRVLPGMYRVEKVVQASGRGRPVAAPFRVS
jgi:hypothetical protein